MPDRTGHVRTNRVSKEDVSAALSAAWFRCARAMGKGTFADRIGVDVKTINRAITGENLPELHNAFASLGAHPTALNEVADLYDVEIRPKTSEGNCDFTTIAHLSHLVGKWVEVMADGVRDHRETLELADVLRPLLPNLNAIVAEADALKGVVAISKGGR